MTGSACGRCQTDFRSRFNVGDLSTSLAHERRRFVHTACSLLSCVDPPFQRRKCSLLKLYQRDRVSRQPQGALTRLKVLLARLQRDPGPPRASYRGSRPRQALLYIPSSFFRSFPVLPIYIRTLIPRVYAVPQYFHSLIPHSFNQTTPIKMKSFAVAALAGAASAAWAPTGSWAAYGTGSSAAASHTGSGSAAATHSAAATTSSAASASAMNTSSASESYYS